jgi:signal transduction histidine kinase
MQALVDERTRALFQAEKLASMGLLAAGVAHEIKNHGGNLMVNSTPAQGSEFIITLPTGNQPQDVVSTASSVSSRSL